MLSNDSKAEFSDTEKQLAMTAADFLGRQMEA